MRPAIRRAIANMLLVVQHRPAGVIMGSVYSVAPMVLATAPDRPAAQAWALEPKCDGYRMVGGQARCWSRHGTDPTGHLGDVLGELRELLRALTLVDGELVVLGSAAGGGIEQDFARFGQNVFGRHDLALAFVVFDALEVAGEQLTERPWHERRAALEEKPCCVTVVA